MKEQLITFETAKLAKEKGFKWECLDSFYKRTFEDIWKENSRDKYGKFIDWNTEKIGVPKNNISRPTQAFLQKWLREIHGIDCLPMLNMSNEYSCHIYKNKLSINQHRDIWNGEGIIPCGRDYDKVLEEGLQESLKLVKDELV